MATKLAPCLLVLIVIAGAPRLALAQDATGPNEALIKAKSLYAEAAYEEALLLLNGLALADEQAIEAAQYRAFCLIALGRTEDATRAIEAVVVDNPLYVPSANDLSPRVLTLFSDTRRKLLPEVIRQLYKEGKAAYDVARHDDAQRQLALVLHLADEPGLDGNLGDLLTLAGGFLELSRAASAKTAAAAAAAAPLTPVTAPSAAGTGTPAAAAAVAQPPVVLRQDFPRWTPLNPADRAQQFDGLVRVIIGTDGTVKEASILDPIHPLYDETLLAAARRWTYRPATYDGKAIESTKVVTVRLFPQ